MAVFTISWLLKTWANLTVDELLFHLKTNLDGTNPDIIKNYIVCYAIPWVLIAIVFIVVLIILRKKKTIQVMVATVGILLSLVLMLYSYNKLDNKLMISDYIQKNSVSSEFIESNYVSPSDVELSFPGQKRNLIYIYLESMEVTYMDTESGGAFETNVIPELTELAIQNEDFSGDSSYVNGGYSFPGCTYTMGALFAQSSGLPLRTGISLNDMDTQETFFPNMVNLGDILEENGYTNELLIGSRATFGGRELYFRSHGNYEIFDYDHAVDMGLIPSNYYRWWGYEDAKLFEYARNELLRLSDSGEPFNLSILTVDTHFEDGYVCDYCDDRFGDDQYSNVFSCSSRQVVEFVNWIQQQPFYENTTIVISGDHPTMDSDYCTSIDEDYTRLVYTCYINSAVTPDNPSLCREYSTLDAFPTTLAAMGVTIEGERLGLGTNLFSSEQTLIELYGRDTVQDQLAMKSPFLESLNVVEITDTLLTRITNRSDLYANCEINNEETMSVNVFVDTYTKLTNSTLIERLEVEVSCDDNDPIIVTLSGFEADGNIYFNEDEILIPNDVEFTISLYMIGTDGERYHIKDISEFSECNNVPEPSSTNN